MFLSLSAEPNNEIHYVVCYLLYEQQTIAGTILHNHNSGEKFFLTGNELDEGLTGIFGKV